MSMPAPGTAAHIAAPVGHAPHQMVNRCGAVGVGQQLDSGTATPMVVTTFAHVGLSGADTHGRLHGGMSAHLLGRGSVPLCGR